MMLDDLKMIHERDTHDALGIVGKQWQQLEHEYEISFDGYDQIDNIVHAGMGGSALWALLSMSWPGYNRPFEIVRDYHIPAYVSDKTLFITSSYSGNTEETLSALAAAEEKQAKIVVIASGGKLVEIAKSKNYPLIELPKTNGPPRYGALYGLNGIITVAERLGLLAQPQGLAGLRPSAAFLQLAMDEWSPTVPTERNLAKQLAQEVMGTSPVIYSGAPLAPAAHKWKISFNENSHNVAWTYTFPEFNHNEFTGWTSHPVEKPYRVLYLLSPGDHERVKRRFELSDKLLSGRWPSPIRIDAQGENQVEQLLWTVALGDFVSLYLAFLNGLSPIDAPEKDIIERFKKELA